MTNSVYNRLIKKLNQIDASFILHQYGQHNEKTSKEQEEHIKEFLGDLSLLQPEIEPELEFTYIEKGLDTFKRYCRALSDHISKTLSDSINRFPSGWIEERYGNASNNPELLLLSIRIEATSYNMRILAKERNINFDNTEQALSIDELNLIYIGTVYSILQEMQKVHDRFTEAQVDPVESITIPSIDSPRHKLVLLKELGLLQELQKNYKTLGHKDLARIICLLCWTTKDLEQKKIDSIISNLEDEVFLVLFDEEGTGKTGRPINSRSVKIVKDALRALGIKESNRLPDFGQNDKE
jgi:hypothetical protein